jgi:hypothetical protein
LEADFNAKTKILTRLVGSYFERQLMRVPSQLLKFLCLAVLFPVVVSGQDKADAKSKPKKEVPKDVLVELVPAAVSRPALRNPLLPPLRDRIRGNAATLYLRSSVMATELRPKLSDFRKDLPKYLNSPMGKFPLEEAREQVAMFEHALHEVHLAARRQDCDWQLPTLEVGTGLYSILLPEVQPLREVARALSIRIRIEIREGRFEDAIDSLQTGYAMGRHMADAPFLVNSLVGVAICQMMNERVIDMAQVKGAPSLYWSLTALPRPLVDMRRAMEFEAASALMVFPELLNAENTGGGESAKQFKEFVDRFENLAKDSTGTQGVEYELRKRLVKSQSDRDAMLKARAFLVEEVGYSEESVGKMISTQVLLLREKALYERLRDDLFKWSFLPYYEAEAGFAAWNTAHEKAKKANEALPLVSLLLPGFDRASQVQARLDRGIILLRIVEAIRLYSAEHDGELPESLSDLSVPVSINPLNGKPFEYARDGEEATLRTIDASKSPLRYRLRVKK